jgi:hypothetical protein
LAADLKKALRERRTIIFIDESGLSERPHRVRTWAPRGQRLVLQYHFNWKVMSAAAGITWWNFYFRVYPATIKAPQVVDFLGHLLRQLRGKLLVIWDGLPAPRGAAGQRVHSRPARPAGDRLVAGLRPGTQPSGVHLGLLEAPRVTQLRATSPSPAARPAAHCAACAGVNR